MQDYIVSLLPSAEQKHWLERLLSVGVMLLCNSAS
jgi:hypothetical protein